MNSNLCSHRGINHCCVHVPEVVPGKTIIHSSFLLPNCLVLESLKKATSNLSLWGWHPHFPLGCDHSSRVSLEALPAQTFVLWQMGDASQLLSKAWHRKTWRGCIIISLAIAGAKNSVTIFVLEPNCSQTASDVYSVEENYPALGLCKSLGKNSQTWYFSSFYFIPFWNMCLDKWQANVNGFIAQLNHSWIFPPSGGKSIPLNALDLPQFLEIGLKASGEQPVLGAFHLLMSGRSKTLKP